MHTGTIIKRIRKNKGLMEKEVSAHLGIDNSNYNKLETRHRNLSMNVIQKLAILFNITTDEILIHGNVVPTAIKVERKPDFEKLHLINQLQEDDKHTVYEIIDTMLAKHKFQTFF